jgi:hypothetical protein
MFQILRILASGDEGMREIKKREILRELYCI